jgi:hypothetical protein
VKVKELIKELQQYDEEAQVVTSSEQPYADKVYAVTLGWQKDTVCLRCEK